MSLVDVLEMTDKMPPRFREEVKSSCTYIPRLHVRVWLYQPGLEVLIGTHTQFDTKYLFWMESA